MPRTHLAFIVTATIVVATSVGAQSWQTIGIPNNTNAGAYWNNISDDNVGNAVCNAGAILTNTPALAAGSCTNQSPNPSLPLSPAPLTTANRSPDRVEQRVTRIGMVRCLDRLHPANACLVTDGQLRISVSNAIDRTFQQVPG